MIDYSKFNYKWFNDDVPNNMKITQVYGIVFNNEGKVLLKYENYNGTKIYSVAGGTPEDFDKSIENTLKREFLEEINTTLKDNIIYLGYQEVDECNNEPKYAQIRMTALVENIGAKQPDPDNGKTYNRILVSPKKAIELLNWQSTGESIINRAVEIAIKNFNIDIYNGDEIVEI